jgi:hypothetical protein
MGTIRADDVLKKIKAREGTCAICQIGCSTHRSASECGHVYLEASDEPIFVLRAQDKTCATVITAWLVLNRKTAPLVKLEEARELMRQMGEWPVKKAAD